MKLCTIEGCENEHRARGWCSTHWLRWKNHGDPLGSAPAKPERLCEVDGCERKHYVKGYCTKHHRRWEKYGTTDLPARQQKPKRRCSVEDCERIARTRGMCGAHAERVRRGVPLEGEIRGSRTFHDSYQAVESGCWEWTAYVDRNGYGKYRGVWAHRVAYILAGGVIPDGFHIDHLCRNTKCVNPDHLEPVTPRENLLRGNNRAAVVIREGKCIRGHERTPENVYIHPSTGLKRCRTCARERHQARDAA